jgi:arginyl-tRNA synthetase
LAAIRYRVGKLGATRVIYVVGSPQSQHFKQVFTAAQKAGWAGNAVLEHAGFGSVLGDDGKMFKARSGDSVKLADLLIEAEDRAFELVTTKSPDLPEPRRRAIAHAVGIGAMKYADLSKDRLGDYTFAWDKMLAMDGNTGPYLQYAYARIQSIFRRAAERGIEIHRPFIAPVKLESPFELALAKHVLRFGEIVEVVARELKPHHLCTYLYELATRFSGFFENCPVLQSEDCLRSSRLTLCEATARTMACGLELLGIEHPEQM